MPTCNVIIKDEVNVKIENLDLDTRKALVRKFKYEDPTARYRPAYKLGRWDGTVSFFGLGGTTYLSMLPQVLEYLEEKNYYINVDDKRNSTELKFDEIFEDFWGEKCWPIGHRFSGQPIRLRDDQVEVINKFLSNPQCIQEIATGFGKTITTATLAKICEKYGRTVTIVPNKSLVEQTEEDFINCGLDVGVYYGDRKDIGKTHTICTWQSLNILEKKSHDDEILSLAEFLDGMSTVMVDECFDGDTLITTPTGKKFIKDLKPGDKVINLCETTNRYKEDTVVKLHKNLIKSADEKMLELEFDTGIKIKVTANHKFLTNKGWVRADELSEDLEILKTFMKLINKKEIETPEITYNLHIKNDHNYIANDAVVANCHMAKAEVLKKLLTQNLSNACIRWGLTGTVPKEDFEFQSLRASLGEVVHRVAAHELQEKGVLAQCHVNIVQTAEWKEFGSYAEELKYLVTNNDRMTWISNLINEISASGNTLVLVDRIESGEVLTANLKDSVFISGRVKTKDRREEYNEVATADNKIIVATYGVAAVGINIPRIFNLVLLEPGKSFVRVIQSIGRGIRKAEDKDFVQIWDLTASTKYAKRHLTQRKKFYKEAKYDYSIQKVKYA